MTAYTFRRAVDADLTTIMAWRAERSEWLRRQGSSQWGDAGLTRDTFANRVRESIAAGETWMADNDQGQPVGTIAVDQHADGGLWSPGELHDAMVVHRMIVPLSAAGGGVGDFLLAGADQVARAAGRQRLVLDAWGSNEGLRTFYASRGFRHLRDARVEDTGNVMALFERPVPPEQSGQSAGDDGAGVVLRAQVTRFLDLGTAERAARVDGTALQQPTAGGRPIIRPAIRPAVSNQRQAGPARLAHGWE